MDKGAHEGHKVFIGGLEPQVTEEDLEKYFSKFGTVNEKLIKMDIKTKLSRGFGFVGFTREEAVDKVLQEKEHRINGKKIDCKRAMTKEEAYSHNKSLKENWRKIFVSNIPRSINKDTIWEAFSKFGEIIDLNLMIKKKETGFCYITYATQEHAQAATSNPTLKVSGHILDVKVAIPKDQKDNRKSTTPSNYDQKTQQAHYYEEEQFLEQPFAYPERHKHHRHSFDNPQHNYEVYHRSQPGYYYGPSPNSSYSPEHLMRRPDPRAYAPPRQNLGYPPVDPTLYHPQEPHYPSPKRTPSINVEQTDERSPLYASRQIQPNQSGGESIRNSQVFQEPPSPGYPRGRIRHMSEQQINTYHQNSFVPTLYSVPTREIPEYLGSPAMKPRYYPGSMFDVSDQTLSTNLGMRNPGGQASSSHTFYENDSFNFKSSNGALEKSSSTAFESKRQFESQNANSQKRKEKIESLIREVEKAREKLRRLEEELQSELARETTDQLIKEEEDSSIED